MLYYCLYDYYTKVETWLGKSMCLHQLEVYLWKMIPIPSKTRLRLLLLLLQLLTWNSIAVGSAGGSYYYANVNSREEKLHKNIFYILCKSCILKIYMNINIYIILWSFKKIFLLINWISKHKQHSWIFHWEPPNGISSAIQPLVLNKSFQCLDMIERKFWIWWKLIF